MSRNEDCQCKILDRVYYVDFDELAEKVRNGRVLSHDPVKIGNSVWTNAGKIPDLAEFFKEHDLKNKLPKGTNFQNILTNFQVGETNHRVIHETENTLDKACAVHTDKSPYYICTICENLFCRDCPVENADNKRICPFCGGNCVLYAGQVWQFENEKTKAIYEYKNEKPAPETPNYEVVYTKLTFRDFINALIYPLRFPVALIVGGILFSVLVFGQMVTLFKGGESLFAAAVGITVVIMMLKFSVLFKCFENLSRKNFQRHSYMPHIKKFGVIEDFVVPFFTGLHSCVVSFGLFIILVFAAGIYAWANFSGNVETTEAEVRQMEQRVNSVINAGKSDPKQRQKREIEIKAMLENVRSNLIESVFGKNHLADNNQLERLINSVMRLTIWFQMPMSLALMIGVLFFPAVCLSAGENRFLSLRKSFISGFKMMKTIGFDYIKILLMCFILLLISVLSIYLLNLLFSKLELPVAGTLSAIAVGSFLIFYFWVAFSSILSTALLNKETAFEETSGNFITD